MSAIPKKAHPTEGPESQIAMMLQHRFGVGHGFMPGKKVKSLYSKARERGYVDGEGYLTRKGRTLVARYKYI